MVGRAGFEPAIPALLIAPGNREQMSMRDQSATSFE